MDLDKGILLVQALAWPVVALSVAPFVIWRLGAIARLYDIIKSGDFVEKVLEAAEKLERFDGALRKVEKNVEVLKDSWQDEEAARLEKDSALLAQRKEVEQIQSEKEFQPRDTMFPDELYARMQSAWDDLKAVVEAKLKSIGKPFDARSLGLAVAPLTDERRSKPLSRSDAEFIAKLQSQFSRFRRLKATKEDWLTAEIYSSFIASVVVAQKLISQSA